MSVSRIDEARTALARARDLSERIVDGQFGSERKEAAALAEARALYEAALEAFRSGGHERDAVDCVAGLGSLALHGAHDPETALPLLLEAAERYGAWNLRREQLAALMEVSEIDHEHPVVTRSVAEAVAAGLPADLRGEEDPIRLLIARREARDLDGALSLAQALIDEALARGDELRAARMLGERGKIEDRRRDRKAAVASLEQAVALAEEAGSNEETLRALLTLIDVVWSTGNQKRARELFARAKTIRGVPQSLRTLRDIMATTLR
ncbi:MAG: hypothetical protein R3F59_35180 [Myxococcota bacterium]